MISITKTITNEKSNEITLSVYYGTEGVTITAVGPDSTVEHTYTAMEAETIYELMTLVRPGYKN